MSTSVWARVSDDPDPDVRLDKEVGYRAGIGNHQTAFQFLVELSELEGWMAFEDEWGTVYDRLGLMLFIATPPATYPPAVAEVVAS